MTGLVTNVINSAPSTSLPPRHWKVTGLTHTEATCHWVQDMATERSEQSLPAGQKPTVPVLEGPEKRHHGVSEAREPGAPERVRGPTARGGKHPGRGARGPEGTPPPVPMPASPERTHRGAHRPGSCPAASHRLNPPSTSHLASTTSFRRLQKLGLIFMQNYSARVMCSLSIKFF